MRTQACLGPRVRNLTVRLTAQRVGRTDEAERSLSRALEIFHDVRDASAGKRRSSPTCFAFGRRRNPQGQSGTLDDADLAGKLSSLALLRRECGSLDEAEEYQRRALALAERVYGPDHASYAACVSNLACIIQKFGKLDEAEVLHRRALQIYSRAPDAASRTRSKDMAAVQMAAVQSNLSLVTQNLAEAEELVTRALETQLQIFGPDHPTVALTLHNVGIICCRTKKFDDAAVAFERALAIKLASLGGDHSSTWKTREWLTAIRDKQTPHHQGQSIAIRRDCGSVGYC